MRAIIHLEVEIEIDYDAYKAEPMTRHYPGNPAYLEINSLFINDKELSAESFNIIMENYEDEINEACRDEIKEVDDGK